MTPPRGGGRRSQAGSGKAPARGKTRAQGKAPARGDAPRGDGKTSGRGSSGGDSSGRSAASGNDASRGNAPRGGGKGSERGAAASADDAGALAAAQRERLRLGENEGIATLVDAAAFLATVGIALRYGASDALPLASMYQAVWRADEPERDAQRRATLLTNGLIEAGTAVETNVVAERICVAHVEVVPALIALRRRGRAADELEVSETARRVLRFLAETPRPTAGQVRAYLGVPPMTWPNAADEALAELGRVFLIDRGAAETPETGAPYLSKDGIPYRLVDAAHAALVRAAAKLSVPDAAVRAIGAYLAGAVYARRTKLASFFKLCLDKAELDAAIAALVAEGRARVAMVDGKELVVSN